MASGSGDDDWGFDAFASSASATAGGMADKPPVSKSSSAMEDLFGDFGGTSPATSNASPMSNIPITPAGASQSKNATPWDVFDAFDPLASSALPTSKPGTEAAGTPRLSASQDLFAIFGGDEPVPRPSTSAGANKANSSFGRGSESMMDAFAEFVTPSSSSFGALPSPTSVSGGGLAAKQSPSMPNTAVPSSPAMVSAKSPASTSPADDVFVEVGFAAFGSSPSLGSSVAPSGARSGFAAFGEEPGTSANGNQGALKGSEYDSRPQRLSGPSSLATFSFAFDEAILRKPAEVREAAVFCWLYNVESGLKSLGKVRFRVFFSTTICCLH
jgi:hypothetical protein